MGSNTHKRNAQEPFRNNFREFQGIKLLPFLFRQNTLHCPSQGFWPVATQDGSSGLTGQLEKVPVRSLDLLGQRIAIEISNDSPARQEGFTLNRKRCWQRCVFLDENSLGSIQV